MTLASMTERKNIFAQKVQIWQLWTLTIFQMSLYFLVSHFTNKIIIGLLDYLLGTFWP
jgi:hypothetical protein